jgi:SAM-dependent methyltransferase
MTEEQAAAYLETAPEMVYPHLEENTEEFPFIDPPVPHPDGPEHEPLKPSGLVREIMHLIGEEEPKRVLDIGAGASPTGLYLAAYGHDVTTIDLDPWTVDWQNHWARQTGLQNNFRARYGSVLELGQSDAKYDLIIGEMLLHFLDEKDARKAKAAMRAATLVGGFNILSAYSDDNPDQEMLPPRSLAQFLSAEDLRAGYTDDEWDVIFEQEGSGHRTVPREFFGKGLVLIPSVVELIVQKTAEQETPLLGISSDITNKYLVF